MKSLYSRTSSFIYANKGLILVLLVAFILRFLNLGYSDFQGDEIKALYIPDSGQSFFDFVMDQRKGPLQFAITFLIKLVDSSYRSYFLVRLPFAFAGFLAVFFFYKLVKLHFGDLTAFIASFFLTTNGFFIAFSRIVQYQSFVILFMVLALYFFSKSVKEESWKIKGVYLGFISWAISLLAHYDGIFIAPFAFYLIYLWFKASPNKKQSVKHLILACLASGLLLASFYIPFVMNLSQATKDYWTGRVTGSANMKKDSSRYLFSVYQPIYSIHIYTLLTVLGVLFILVSLVKAKTKILKNINFLNPSDLLTSIFILIWLALAAAFMELYVSIPGTHIYVYLLPLFIVVSWGTLFIGSLIERLYIEYISKFFFGTLLVVLLGFLTIQSFGVFVDHNIEYPWSNKRFLIWTFPRPTPIYNLSLFGFPYNRNWQGISDYVKTLNDIHAYSTNERQALARYYVPYEKTAEKAGVYVYIKNPQTFINEITDDKALYWTSRYAPLYTFSRNGEEIVRLYLMKPGTWEELKAQGY